MKNLRIETLVLGVVMTNCYLAVNKESHEALIIDPPAHPERISQRLEELGAKPMAILLTHGHFDHIGAAEALKKEYEIPIYAMEQEREILENTTWNLSSAYGGGYTVKADHFLKDGDVLELAGFEIQVLHTPGHTAGGACYYLPEEAVLFSGDTLFQESVGRTDFPTGSMSRLHHSVHTKLFVLPEETAVYPGHGESTGISYEKRYNPY